MDEAKLKDFECERCGECCRQAGFVYVSPEETEKIAQLLRMDSYVFVNRYCDLFDRRRLVLKKHKNETCLFFVEGKCEIHDAKPRQCLDFPKKWRTIRSLEYCQGLRKIISCNSKI